MGERTGRERERGWRPVNERRMGTETGAETETRAVVEMKSGTRMGMGTGTRTGSRRAKERRRSARNRTRVVNAIRHFVPHASPSLQTGGGACGHPTAPFARFGVCTRVLRRGGNRVRGTGSSERGRERKRERRREWGGGRERGHER